MKYKIDILGTEWEISKPIIDTTEYFLNVFDNKIYYTNLEKSIDIFSEKHTQLRKAILIAYANMKVKNTDELLEFLAKNYDEIHLAMRDMELIEC